MVKKIDRFRRKHIVNNMPNKERKLLRNEYFSIILKSIELKTDEEKAKEYSKRYKDFSTTFVTQHSEEKFRAFIRSMHRIIKRKFGDEYYYTHIV